MKILRKHILIVESDDNDEMVYFIESGQVKLRMLSPEGRERLRNIGLIETNGNQFLVIKDKDAH